MSLLAVILLSAMKGLIKFRNLLLISIPFSETLVTYLLILFLFILAHLFFCFLYAALFSADGSTQYLFLNLLLTNFFLKLSIHKRCIVTPYKFLFQRSMFVNDTEELISQKIVILIRVVFETVKICFFETS